MKQDPETLRSKAQGTIPVQAFTDQSNGLLSKTYLSGKSIYERLADTEVIQYLLVNGSKGLNVTQKEPGVLETYTPDGGFRALSAVTNQRVFFVIGKRDDDRCFDLNRNDITGASLRSGLLSTKVEIETSAATYTFRVNKRASSAPSDAVDYVQSSLVPDQPTSGVETAQKTDDTEQNSDTTKTLSTHTTGLTDGGPTGTEQITATNDLSEPSRDDLIEDLRQVHERIGDVPSLADVRNYGDYRGVKFFKEFSTWVAAVEAAFPEVEEDSTDPDSSDLNRDGSGQEGETADRDAESEPTASEPSRDEFVEEIERVAEKLEKRPTMGEFDTNARFDSSDVYDHFDGWNDAIDAATFEVGSRDELLDELHRLESELGYPPLSTHVNERSRFSTYDYELEFGGVDEALNVAGIDVKAQVMDTLSDVVARADGKPIMADFGAASVYSEGVIYKYFDSWDDAIAAATPKEHAVDDGDNDDDTEPVAPEQNELSEQYELLRNLQTLVTAIVETHEPDENNQPQDPMIQWASAVDEFFRNGPADTEAYGEQQRERNPFSMRDYRLDFGNGDRVTEFAETSASQLSPTLRALLDSLVDTELDAFYLPVDPESKSPLPVVVASPSELQRAVSMLERLPSEPMAAQSGSQPSPVTPPVHGTQSELTEVSGVTEDSAQKLEAAGYGTEADLRDAEMDEIATVDGIGHQLAMRIKLDVGE